MTMTPRLFRVNADDKTSVAVREVDFSELGLRERDDIQKWVAANPRILDQDLLVITEEFSEFDKTDERLDLLAVDSAGNLVDNQQVDEDQIAVEVRDFRKIAIRIGADELDDEFVKRAAESLRNFIDTITPAVDRAL